MISVKNLSFNYCEKEIIHELSLDLNHGETIMLTGPNGVGKSTLLRILAGVLKPSDGTVEYGFRNDVDPRSRIAFLPDSLSFYRNMTPLQAASFHAGFFDTEPSGLKVAEKAGVDLNGRIEDLSIGQRIIVQLSIILSTGPDLVLIDEVLHSVDPYLRGLLFQELIGVMEKKNPAVVLVNLNFTEVENLVDRVVFLGRSGIKLDESVEKLKAGIRLMESENMPENQTVVRSREVLGKREFIVYPY